MGFPRIRAVCHALHRWIGIALAVLLIPVSLSGAALVWHDHFDAMVDPSRYAVTGASVAQPLSGGDVVRMPAPLAGDRAALWIRRIHDGGRGGPVWQALVFLTGVLPALFAVTGTMIWLRGRRLRRAKVTATATLQAAK